MCCIVADVLAAVAADMSEKLDTVKVDTVSLPIALGLWLMMWPVLTKVGASARRPHAGCRTTAVHVIGTSEKMAHASLEHA